MRKIFTLIGLTIFLIGCNESIKKKNNEEKMKKDSINAIKAEKNLIEKAKQDSLILIEQEKVIGTILFGMNENVVKSKIKEFKNENKKPFKISDYTSYNHFIGNYEFNFIRDFYYQDKLYKIRIIGKVISWENFDSEVPVQIKAISDILKIKYGNPEIHNDLKPRYKLKKNYTYLIDNWNIGTKEIQVRVSDNGTFYSVNVIIIQSETENKINREQKEKENQETLKGTNAF